MRKERKKKGKIKEKIKSKIKEGKGVCRVQNIFQVPPLLSLINLCHVLLPYLLQTHFNISISFMRTSSKRSSPLRLSVQYSVYICLPSNISVSWLLVQFGRRNLLKLRTRSSDTLHRLIW